MTVEEITKRANELEEASADALDLVVRVQRNLRTHREAMFEAIRQGDPGLALAHLSRVTEWLPLQLEAWSALRNTEQELIRFCQQSSTVIGELQEQVAAAVLAAPLRVH